jgi:hypothetical protein
MSADDKTELSTRLDDDGTFYWSFLSFALAKVTLAVLPRVTRRA